MISKFDTRCCRVQTVNVTTLPLKNASLKLNVNKINIQTDMK